MALDAANFISELSITDPPGTDPLSQGDDQIRTIKRATFQSFPNIAAEVSLTDAQLNLAAIKNEANVFTNPGNNFQGGLRIDRVGVNASIFWDTSGLLTWRMIHSSIDAFQLERYQAAILQDIPFTVSNSTGVVDFFHVPEVQGAPLWIAGEIRQFAVAATPGTNWFLADGTNGTVNLADRWLVGAGSFAGAVGTNLNASLDAQTVAGNTGATALSVGQMPAHGHAVRSGGSSGVTDVTISAVSNETVVGGNRGNTAPSYATNNSQGNAVIQQSGSGNTHSHTVGILDVVANNPTFTGSVQPVSVAVETYQYVP